MDKTQLKSLVQQVVEAYLKEHIPEQRNTSIAILFGYQSPNQLEVLQAVTPLLHSYDVKILLMEDWLIKFTEHYNHPYILLNKITMEELHKIIEQTSLLVIPVASYQLLSKLALTMDDDLVAWLAIQYQLLGKPIVVANDNIEPNVYQQIHAPFSVLERLQSYIRQTQSEQVKWVPLNKLQLTVDEQWKAYQEKKSLILAKHIEKAHFDGLQEIIVPRNSHVTPSARDKAKELKIQIVIQNSLKGG